jgi:hypothetical protein
MGSSVSDSGYRHLCERIYAPPLIPPEVKPYDLAKQHGFDWRSTFLEDRRLRYDGIYISVCHYMYVQSRCVQSSTERDSAAADQDKVIWRGSM